ncbi:MAG: protein-glutamate O-methyltransferase CheR [Isosphaeraceae bacterium]
MQNTELTDEEFQRFCGLIYRNSGIRIADTKRVLVSNRVRRRLRSTGIKTFAEYYLFLTSPAGAGEMPQFLDAITTNETYFYRDKHHYAWLGEAFLPEVAAQAAQHKRPRRLRIWSAACSTGEEPYSIALKVLENRLLLPGFRTQIVGTDLSGTVLALARAGSYDERAVHLVGAEEKKRYFDEDPKAKRWTVKDEVRSLVTWKLHNLLTPLREEPFDCIFLKNVLIYFDKDSKATVVKHILAAVAKGGYLVIGPTEGIYGMLDPLVKLKPWLFQRLP